MLPQFEFRVINQTLSRVDSFEPVSGSKNYLLAFFDFTTKDWEQIDTKTAVFMNEQNDKIEVVISDGICFVPSEILKTSGFIYVSVYGGDRITTNWVSIFVDEGYTEEENLQNDSQDDSQNDSQNG